MPKKIIKMVLHKGNTVFLRPKRGDGRKKKKGQLLAASSIRGRICRPKTITTKKGGREVNPITSSELVLKLHFLKI
jgi:hypothetical protein